MNTVTRIRNGFRWAATLALLPVALGGLMTTTAAQAQNAPQTGPPLLQTKFVDNEQGWMAVGGDKAKVMVASDGDKKVLRFDYDVAKSGMMALALPVNQNEITPAKSFRFSVKADTTTTLAVALQEQDSGRWIAFFHVPADKWQTVTLAPSDFVLSENEGDPKDNNGKLDLDQVQMVAILDVQQIFAQADNPTMDMLFNIKKGPHHLLLGDFTVGSDALAGAPFLNKTDARLDTFGYPQIGWLAVGGAELMPTSGQPLGVRGFQANFQQGPGKIAGFVRQIPRGRLEGKEKLTFTLAAKKPMQVVVQVEEVGGGKYNAILDVPGGEMPKEFTVLFSDMKQSDDSKDTNNKLDLDKVHQIVILDPSGMLGSATPGENTIWLGGLRAL